MNLDEITEERRKALAATIRPVDNAEVRGLGERLFPYHDDPWRESFLGFLAENPGASFYHAAAADGLQVLYCSSAKRGIWFVPGKGVGILQPRGLEMLSEIVAGAA